MFSWVLSAQSNRIKEILNSENFKIEDLLQESYDIVVCAANDPLVYNRLKEPSILIKLFDYILKEPVKRDEVASDQIPELQRQLLFSTTASDTIVQSTHLLEAILQEKPVLSIVFKGFKEFRTHMVFHRLTTLFMALFSVGAQELVEYITSEQPDFLKTLVSKIGIAPTEDIISLIKQFLRANNKSLGLIEWLAKEQLIRLLISNLSSNSNDTTCRDTITVLQEVTSDIIIKSQLSDDYHDNTLNDDLEIHFTSSDDERPKPTNSILLLHKQYEEVETLELLFSNLFSSYKCQVYSLPFVMNLISQNAFPTLLQKSLQYIDNFLNTLKPNPNDPPEANFGRLITLRFLIMLLKLDNPQITQLLVEKNSFAIVFELFFVFKNNTVMHNLILEYFTIGLSRNQYIFSIISSSHIIYRIIDAWDQINLANETRLIDQGLYDHAHSWLKKLFRNFKHEKNFPVDVAVRLQIIRGSSHWTYFGHLFKLSNLLVGICQQTTPELIHVSQREVWLQQTENERWKKFTQEALRVYNTISSQKLSQEDSSSESQESSEDFEQRQLN